MSEHPNAGLLRRMYEAVDPEVLRELIAEDAVWHQPGRTRLAGTYEGRDAIVEFLAAVDEASDATVSFEVIAILADDQRVVSIHRETAQREGRSLDTTNVLRADVRDGKLAEFWIYLGDPYGEADFWS